MNLNTFKSMLRPGAAFNEQETEKREEMTPMETMRRNSLSLNEDYPSTDMSFLNSDVFVDDGTNVLIAMPRDMEDAEIIAEAIQVGKALVVMLDDLDKGMDQRILDFINGVCYNYKIVPRQLREEKKFVIDPLHKRGNRNFR